MKCIVCGHESFVRDEYRCCSVRCPALACAKCGAMKLDERAAESADERDAVREIQERRARALSEGVCVSSTRSSAPPESHGTRPPRLSG